MKVLPGPSGSSSAIPAVGYLSTFTMWTIAMIPFRLFISALPVLTTVALGVPSADVQIHYEVSRDTVPLEGKPTTICSGARMQKVEAALPFASGYVINALDTLELRDSSANDTYRTWFGTITPKRLQLVKSHFTEIAKNNFTEYKYFCGSLECNPNRYAHVDPDK
ncbi:hypothetical protein C8Q78DRAFT_568515 [Trametes maxima]|nr:hypothetical protein C8Q78DRAFT_568515 [Trametes maxima]